MSAGMADVPVKRVELATQDQDEATEFIRQMYVGHRPRFAAAARPTEFAISAAGCAGLRADQVRNSFQFQTILEPFQELTFIHVRGGRMRIRNGSWQQQLGPGDSALIPTGVLVLADLSEFDVTALRMPMSQVAAMAAGYGDIDAVDLRFAGMAPISKQRERYWNQTTRLVQQELFNTGTGALNPLIVQELGDTVAAAALTVFPNTTMTDRRSGSGWASSPVVRQAMHYIDAQAGQPINAMDIAAATGVTARALRYAFRRHVDTTPAAYLRRVRLDRAHHELQAADPADGTTVAHVAARWGYRKPDRFAAHYRSVYGVLPRKTLHNT